jgi:ABC-type Fe3+-siderophore transport system permease subunit
MKTLRNLAGILLLITGILHIVMYFQNSADPGIIGVLVFGVIYCIVGLLLFNKKLYPIYLGAIIPLIGMTLSIIKFGIPKLMSMLALFKIIGLIAVVLCLYLIIRRKEYSVNVQA